MEVRNLKNHFCEYADQTPLFFAYYYLGFRVQHEKDRIIINIILMVNTVFGMDERLKRKYKAARPCI